MLVTPLLERGQHHLQLVPGRGQPVGEPGAGAWLPVRARHVSSAKSDPADIAKIALDGIAAGDAEIIADELSKQVLAALSSGVAGLYPQLA